METDLELRVVVESVEIEGCVYKPAQAHRITGPGPLPQLNFVLSR